MQGFPRVHVRKYGKSPTAAVGDTTLGYSENANGLTMERGCDFQLPVSFDSEPNLANIPFSAMYVPTYVCMHRHFGVSALLLMSYATKNDGKDAVRREEQRA